MEYTEDYEPEANFAAMPMGFAVWESLIAHQQALKVKYTDIEKFEFIDFSEALKLTSFFEPK